MLKPASCHSVIDLRRASRRLAKIRRAIAAAGKPGTA